MEQVVPPVRCCFCSRAAAASAIVTILAACASLPSAHYRFALAANDVGSPPQWSAKPLPSRGRIYLTGRAREEAASKAARVIIRFGDPDASLPRAALALQDAGCSGAYSFSLEHLTRSSTSAVEYFDRKLPWGAPLKVRVEWWPDGRLEIEVEDVGKESVHLPRTVDRVQIRVFSGGLDVEDLDYENLSSS